ncbi:pentatricopeptide repeat protein [Apiospora saccharicola]|uniref:Pentatricopeptide repeat protein n=1 Tax=Apiospora saccharicola TaxID=335842 RepID=A0ABR1WDA4_9PEZI
MFTCRACTRRLLTAVVDHALSAEPTHNVLRRSIISATTAQQTRGYAVAASASVVESAIRGETEPVAEPSPMNSKEAKALEWSVNKQLEYLSDPFHIANTVQAILNKGRFDEAKMMVLKASKDKNIAVSWNHLIDYEMRHQKLHSGIKLFNEMKKRAQMSTAQTYTIIFRGCAQSDHKKLAVAEAVKLYNNMLKSDRIKPNTQHYNALLQVCARAGDIDTMFTIVQSSNTGLRAPDAFTYTTILNALRAKLEIDPRKHRPKGEREQEVKKATEQTIQRAKAIWEEVIAKWRSASLVIDEQLVCAMARILLLGPSADNKAVLALVEQTMGIPQDEPGLIKMVREAHLVPPEVDVREKPSKTTRALQPRKPTGGKGPKPGSALQAKPGNNTLSAILTALQQTAKTSMVPRYWDVFTRRYGVSPDALNWHHMIRSLRYGHNSSKVAEYLWIMPKAFMSEATFRIAMNACLRDNLNQHAFHNGSQVLEVMLTSLRAPDAHVMRIYLQLAHAVKRPFEDMAKKDPQAAKLAFGKQLTTALGNLWEPYCMATKQFAFGGLAPRTPPPPPTPKTPLAPVSSTAATTDGASASSGPATTSGSDIGREMWKLHATARGEIAALARKMIAAYDRLIFGDLATSDIIAKLKPRRNQINAFVVKYFEDREKYEPKWSFKRMQEEKKQMEMENNEDEDDLEFLEGTPRRKGPELDAW